MRDEWAIVLDFLPRGHTMDRKSEPTAQVIGENNFSLLEIVPRQGVSVSIGDKVYIGSGRRDKIKYIKRRINSDDLTVTAKSEMEIVVKELIEKNKDRFVSFFNNADAISTRLHQLELLPGIGRKHMWEIIDERKKGNFKSFDDLKKRVPLLPEPEEMIYKRIMTELEGKQRYYFFVIPYKRVNQ